MGHTAVLCWASETQWTTFLAAMGYREFLCSAIQQTTYNIHTWNIGLCYAAQYYRLAIGTYRLAIGNCGLAIGSYRLATHTYRLAIGTYRLAIGTYRLVISTYRLAIGSRVGTICVCFCLHAASLLQVGTHVQGIFLQPIVTKNNERA